MSEYQLTNIKINKLFGEKSYDIYLEDNKLVFFAENGSGKTTILNIVAAFLSKEWYRLYSYPFESIECRINDKKHFFKQISKSEIQDKEKFEEFIKNKTNPSSVKDDVIEILKETNLGILVDSGFDQKNIPFFVLDRKKKLRDEDEPIELLPSEQNNILEYIEEQYSKYLKSFYENDANYTSLKFYPVILLPTYRVIEKEMHLLLQFEIPPTNLLSKKGKLLYEVFEFGMGTVGQIWDNAALSSLEQNFNKVNEYIALCNEYIHETKYLILENDGIRIRNKKQEDIDPEQLSSGEKHILSIFAYLFFENEYFVIFDEPEISLSLLWQKRILLDTMRYCKGFLSATHSPFVSKIDEVNQYQYVLDHFLRRGSNDSTK